jgi:hypothetical protein
MMPPPSQERAWEHYVVAQVARAAAGLIAADVVGLAAEITSDAVVLHAALEHFDDGLLDDLDHICFELDVLLDGHVQISHSETMWAQWPWPRAGWHPIYVAKGRTELPPRVAGMGG